MYYLYLALSPMINVLNRFENVKITKLSFTKCTAEKKDRRKGKQTEKTRKTKKQQQQQKLRGQTTWKNIAHKMSTETVEHTPSKIHKYILAMSEMVPPSVTLASAVSLAIGHTKNSNNNNEESNQIE